MNVLVRDWRRYKTYKEASPNNAKQKVNDDGQILEWVHGGKRVEVRIIKTKRDNPSDRK
jgi:hypothetical protein